MHHSALLILADNYGAHHGISHWRVSYRAMRKGDFFARIRGASVTRTHTNRVARSMATNT